MQNNLNTNKNSRLGFQKHLLTGRSSMDSKEIKSQLKDAREAIKNKDFATSMRICKNVLRCDKGNYMALVFFGISLQEAGPKDQAPKAFYKAIAISADQPLAWNGLANYYDKDESDETSKELITVYEKLLGMESETSKFSDLCTKLVTRLLKVKEYEKGADILKQLALNEKISDNNRRTAWLELASLLSQSNNLSPELLSLFELTLSSIINDRKSVTCDYYKEYLKLLYKLKKYPLLFDEASIMHSKYESNIYPLEWMCKIYVELTIENNPIVNQFEDRIDQYSQRLLELQQDAVMGIFTRGVKLFRNKQFTEARDDLKKVLSIRAGLTHAWVILAECLLNLYCYTETVQIAIRADKLLQSLTKENLNLRQKIDGILICALAKSNDTEKWKQALELGEKCVDRNNADILPFLILANINLENYEIAKSFLEKLDHNSINYHLLSAKLLRKQGDLNDALNILNLVTDQSCELNVEIGTLHWDLKQHEASLMPFLKAAKLDPNYYLCFVYLGRYYEFCTDIEKARRCYQKAFRINSRCYEAGLALSNIYRQQKNWAANLDLLQSITGTKTPGGLHIISPDVRWAWLQLGLHFMEQGEYNNAIDSLRSVIRVEPDNGHYWECLADAYMARGAYTSALRSYQRATELTEIALYPKFQIASIYLLLGSYEEAKLEFEDLLSKNDKYVPALKGYAENSLNLAFSQKSSQLLGLCRDNAQLALENLTTALKERGDLSCLWKLCGDCCILVATLPKKYSYMNVNSLLAEGREAKDLILLHKENLFKLSSRCYCKAISLMKSNILLWYDLAVCYYSHACAMEDFLQRDTLLKRAFATAKYCITNCPMNFQYWNLFGVIAANNDMAEFALAQHAFIKAVSLERNSAIAWCNLGTLYLLHNESIMANKAYAQAQRADASYVNSWVGQALIAEAYGHEEAMNLFRHSTQLGHQSQSALGYAHWVCQTILKASPHDVIYSIHNMHAIPVACDAITWYTENNRDDASAWNMLGLLRERLGLKSSAIEAFNEALERADDSCRDKVLVNCARMLVKIKKYNEAIGLFKQIKEASFNGGCGLALAQFKAEQYAESYESYNTTMQWLTDSENLQSHVLVALAAMVYMFQEPDSAKPLLFQSTQLKPPSQWGLFATLALGLLHGDFTLAQLVLKELQAIKDKPEIVYHYSVLQSLAYLMQGDKKSAIRSMTKSVHRHPGQPSLWLFLSTLLLQVDSKNKSPAAAKCAQVAMKMGRSQMDVSKVLCIASMAAHVAKDTKTALKLAQRAIHCYPDVAEGWAVLISTLNRVNNPNNAWSRQNEFVKMSIEHTCNNLNPSKNLAAWLRESIV